MPELRLNVRRGLLSAAGYVLQRRHELGEQLDDLIRGECRRFRTAHSTPLLRILGMVIAALFGVGEKFDDPAGSRTELAVQPAGADVRYLVDRVWGLTS